MLTELLVSLALAAVSPILPAFSQDPSVLEVRIPVERELAPGERHSYRVTLAAG